MQTRLWQKIPDENRLLIFGGIYGNLEALEQLIAWQKAQPHQITWVFLGDSCGYCADSSAVINRLERLLGNSDIKVAGNVDFALANENLDCGCGFGVDTSCAAFSRQWYQVANSQISLSQRKWLKQLPSSAFVEYNGIRIAICHASMQSNNEFIYASSNRLSLQQQLQALQANLLICSHSGIPFSAQLPNGIWHNCGALGMPANDGTNRTWFSSLERTKEGKLMLQHHDLDLNDRAVTINKMKELSLPAGYCDCLDTGFWPSDSVLPNLERMLQGHQLHLKPLILQNKHMT